MLELNRINSFYGKAHILHDLTLSIAEGEVVALLGRNGAGKSTTLKTVMQLITAASGSVVFDGQDITSWPVHRVAAAGVGYVPENRRVFSDLTVEENLEVGRQPPRPGVPVWTSAIIFELFPNLLDRRQSLAKSLSGGEQQMLTIARTLMGNPRLLLLDEPSEGIAPVIVEQMVSTILKLKQQRLTVLLSEQNLHFARLVADRAVIIDSGHIRFQGTFASLEARPELRNAYLAV